MNPDFESVDTSYDQEAGVEISTSGYRLQKIEDRLQKLEESLSENDAVYESSGLANSVSQIYNSLDDLLNLTESLGEFDLSEDQLDMVLGVTENLETLLSDYRDVRSEILQEESEGKGGVEFYLQDNEEGKPIKEFQSQAKDLIDEIKETIDKIPADLTPSFELEEGLGKSLTEAIRQEDDEQAKRVIKKIDRLINDNYTLTEKDLGEQSALNFRVKKAIEEGNKIPLSGDAVLSVNGARFRGGGWRTSFLRMLMSTSLVGLKNRKEFGIKFGR